MDIFMGQEEYIHLPVLQTIIQLVAITIVPIALGMIINHFEPAVSEKAELPVKIFSMAFLFLIVIGIIVKNLDQMGSNIAQAGLATIILNLVCLLVGYGAARLAKLNEAQSKAIGIEVGFQNGTLAIVIALTMLKSEEMAIAASTYSIVMFVTGALFAWVLNRKSIEARVELKTPG